MDIAVEKTEELNVEVVRAVAGGVTSVTVLESAKSGETATVDWLIQELPIASEAAWVVDKMENDSNAMRIPEVSANPEVLVALLMKTETVFAAFEDRKTAWSTGHGKRRLFQFILVLQLPDVVADHRNAAGRETNAASLATEGPSVGVLAVTVTEYVVSGCRLKITMAAWDDDFVLMRRSWK